MKTYEIPETLADEIAKFGSDIQEYRHGAINPVAFKGIRVAHGIYEQRKPETHMVRIRCAGGMIKPAQLRRVAEISKRYGAPHFHVTTRQDVQLHYVDLEDVIDVYESLVEVGLSSRGGGGNTVRNIMCSPDSGIRPDETFDVAPYCLALTSRMLAEPDSWNLPRKFKIAFSNHDDDSINATITCLGFIAKIRDGKTGFRVYVGGGMGSKPMLGEVLYDFVPHDRVYVITKAVKIMFDKYGNRRGKHTSRLKFLWKKLGREEFTRLLEVEMRDLERISGLALKLDPLENKVAENLPAPQAVSPVDQDSFNHWQRRYAREQKQDGLLYIKVPLKLGDIDNDDGVRLAELLQPFGENTIRLSLNQNLFLRNIPETHLGNIWNGLQTMNTLAATPVVVSNMVACTGADTCKLGLCLPRGVVPEIERRLLASSLDLDGLADIKIHVSGCPNTCGRHHAADIGFFGRVGRSGDKMYPAYNILAGARIQDGESRFAERLDEISVRHTPQFVVDLLEAYVSKREGYADFIAYIDGDGREDIRRLAEKHRHVPTYEENKDYYFDWGADEEFSLLKGQKAECSAGVFDMIDVDVKHIETYRGELPSLKDNAAIAEKLYQIVFSAARMLLVTRGIEARSDEHVFRMFVTHFIESSLVPEKYRSVVELAGDGDRENLIPRREEVLALGDVLIELYKSMDDSLRFKNIPTCEPASGDNTPGFDALAASQPKAQEAVETTPDQFRDFRGVGCPINFVKTKIALEPMADGQRLEIWLDDGEPIENVPNSVALEGHRVLKKELRDSFWSVLIEKVV